MLAKTCLILSIITLVSCADHPPVEVLDIPDFKLGFTQRYNIIDVKTLSVDAGVEKPLETVDKEVCMPPEQYILLKKFLLKQHDKK